MTSPSVSAVIYTECQSADNNILIAKPKMANMVNAKLAKPALSL